MLLELVSIDLTISSANNIFHIKPSSAAMRMFEWEASRGERDF